MMRYWRRPVQDRVILSVWPGVVYYRGTPSFLICRDNGNMFKGSPKTTMSPPAFLQVSMSPGIIYHEGCCEFLEERYKVLDSPEIDVRVRAPFTFDNPMCFPVCPYRAYLSGCNGVSKAHHMTSVHTLIRGGIRHNMRFYTWACSPYPYVSPQ